MRASSKSPSLFAEIVEFISTPDEPFEDSDGGFGTRIMRPHGKGWRVADYSHDSKTLWSRRRAIVPPKRRGGGGWLK
ncbi:MAG TPA: hypothetical protein VGX71_05350 [Pseudaminobacter sp.]|nr:hypothetical protein [Pseudaminobacter sp.]